MSQLRCKGTPLRFLKGFWIVKIESLSFQNEFSRDLEFFMPIQIISLITCFYTLTVKSDWSAWIGLDGRRHLVTGQLCQFNTVSRISVSSMDTA